MTAREQALAALAALPDPRDAYERRAELIRAAFNAGANISEIARAAQCERLIVRRAIRREAAQ